MHIFLAGATGALGKPLTRALVAAGHHVTGTTRSRPEAVGELGAEPVVLDALDRDAVRRAVAAASPDVVVHQLTAIGKFDARRPDKTFAATNRLRTEGLDILLAAAREAGAERFVAQSYAGWPYARSGPPAKDEDAPLDPEPPKGIRETHAAIRHLEATVLARRRDRPALRRLLRARHEHRARRRAVRGAAGAQVPAPGRGDGVWSLVHIEDAAAATVAAIERGRPGIYNVVDDEPAPVREWLPALAEAVGSKPPRRLPTWLARLALGPAGFALMNESRGALNGKARRELGWTPAHPSWRQGFTSLTDKGSDPFLQ